MIGSGILNQPYVFKKAGILSATFLYLVIFPMIWFGPQLMILMYERYPLHSYGKIAEKAFGKVGYWLMELAIIANTFGANLTYLILIGTLGSDLINVWVKGYSDDELGDDYQYKDQEIWFMVIVTVTCIFPICLIREYGNLSYVSYYSVLAITMVVCLVLFYSPSESSSTSSGSDSIRWASADNGFVQYGSIIYSSTFLYTSMQGYRALRVYDEDNMYNIDDDDDENLRAQTPSVGETNDVESSLRMEKKLIDEGLLTPDELEEVRKELEYNRFNHLHSGTSHPHGGSYQNQNQNQNQNQQGGEKDEESFADRVFHLRPRRISLVLSPSRAESRSYSNKFRLFRSLAFYVATIGMGSCYLIGLVGYLSFKDETKSDILENFNGSYVSFFKLVMMLHLILFLPTEFVVMRDSILALAGYAVGDLPQMAYSVFTGFLLFLIASIVVTLLSYQDSDSAFSFVVDFIGGLATSVCAFILPSLMYQKLMPADDPYQIYAKVISMVALIFLILLIIFSFV
jgi:amino acid permease